VRGNGVRALAARPHADGTVARPGQDVSVGQLQQAQHGGLVPLQHSGALPAPPHANGFVQRGRDNVALWRDQHSRNLGAGCLGQVGAARWVSQVGCEDGSTLEQCGRCMQTRFHRQACLGSSWAGLSWCNALYCIATACPLLLLHASRCYRADSKAAERPAARCSLPIAATFARCCCCQQTPQQKKQQPASIPSP